MTFSLPFNLLSLVLILCYLPFDKVAKNTILNLRVNAPSYYYLSQIQSEILGYVFYKNINRSRIGGIMPGLVLDWLIKVSVL